mgnify:CR=1 FL=1
MPAIRLLCWHRCLVLKFFLGTATPCVESYFNAISGKYGFVELKERYQDIQLPHIELVDIKELAHQKRMQGPFSPRLVKEIKEALERKEQVIFVSKSLWLCSDDRMSYLRLGSEV